MTTRANVESVLVRRCGALLTAAGLAITVAGANADLNDPIGSAIRKLGGSVSSIATVADADIDTFSADFTIDALLDVAELRALETIQGNYALVNISAGPETEALGSISDKLEKRIVALTARIEKQYGIGAATLSSGVLTLDFADHNDTIVGTGLFDIYGRPLE